MNIWWAVRYARGHKVPVWDCKVCDSHAVIYVADRGHICMNCGEEQ